MAVSAHHAAIGMIFPPFLDHLRYSVSAIGTLASMGPILALAARIPSGIVYRRGRTKPLMVFLVAGLLRAVVIVANTISMVEEVDESRMGRGMASGLFNAAGDLGAILGPSLGGWVASFTGVRDLFIVGPLLIMAAFFLTLWGCRFVGRSRPL